ncbi:MAG: AAA family ATPase, partial [Synergistaceae bacterium]|nr:AAA family ATPase [Synergistaceae bacterium]
MAITSLKLKGFKSFGNQCGFEFSKNFTAIVGPNGSGKSNILDALKWILGEASASGLRITKQSDLLFQGSASTSAAKDAEVILKLENENDKGTLRRFYSQDTGALLFFDGKKILLQELDGVKSRFNLEGEGFALIGQGEISDTIHQRPKERRKQFDALFGIERYRQRRDDSIKKLSDAENESIRIKTLIEELNTRREEISDEVKVAIEAQGILDELDALRQDYYFFRRLSIEREQSDFELKRDIVTSKLDDCNRWLKFWSKSLDFYEEKLSADTSGNLFLSQLDNITTQKNSVHRKAFQFSTQIKEIKSRRIELQTELDNLNIQKQALYQERERTNNEHKNLSDELDIKTKEFNEREKVFNDARKKTQNEIARRKKIFDDTAELKLKRSRLEADIAALEKTRETNSGEITQLENERANIQ